MTARLVGQLPEDDLGEGKRQAQQILAVHAVLKPRQRRLARQRLVEPLPARKDQRRVAAERVHVVGVPRRFAAALGDGIEALSQKLFYWMHHFAGFASVQDLL